MTNFDFASIIARNNAGEQEAIEGYMQVLATPGLPPKLYEDIKEIISDEMNHSEKLSYWATQLSGIKPATS